MMSVLGAWSVVLVALGQFPGPGTGTNASQVGALYAGGENARPRLNRANCGSNNALVGVDFSVQNNIQNVANIPFGVLYTQDVSIPANVTNTGASSSGGVVQLRAAVACAEPVQAKIITDNITLLPGLTSFPMSQHNPLVPTVSEFMADLCSADGGVRTRRAYCFGVRQGQGAATTVRGGDGPDIDTVPPGPPARIVAQAGDEYVDVTLAAPAGTDSVEAQAMRYVVEYRRCSNALQGDGGLHIPDAGTDADGGHIDALATVCEDWRTGAGPSASPVQVGGLDNGVLHELRAYAVDDFDNVGPRGGTAFARPIKEYGLLDLYGGEVYGASCQGSSPAAWAVWIAVGALVVRWRSRKGAK